MTNSEFRVTRLIIIEVQQLLKNNFNIIHCNEYRKKSAHKVSKNTKTLMTDYHTGNNALYYIMQRHLSLVYLL